MRGAGLDATHHSTPPRAGCVEAQHQARPNATYVRMPGKGPRGERRRQRVAGPVCGVPLPLNPGRWFPVGSAIHGTRSWRRRAVPHRSERSALLWTNGWRWVKCPQLQRQRRGPAASCGPRWGSGDGAAGPPFRTTPAGVAQSVVATTLATTTQNTTQDRPGSAAPNSSDRAGHRPPEERHDASPPSEGRNPYRVGRRHARGTATSSGVSCERER